MHQNVPILNHFGTSDDDRPSEAAAATAAEGTAVLVAVDEDDEEDDAGGLSAAAAAAGAAELGRDWGSGALRYTSHTHTFNGHLSTKLRLAGCPHDNLTRGFGAKFYAPDAVPDINS